MYPGLIWHSPRVAQNSQLWLSSSQREVGGEPIISIVAAMVAPVISAMVAPVISVGVATVASSIGASTSTADSMSSASGIVAGGALTTQAPKLQDLAQFGSMNSGFIWHSP